MTARTVERISVVVVVAVLGAALAVNVHGAPVALLLAALVVTVCAGLDLVLRGEARYHATPDLFILPAAVVTGGVLFISLLASGVAIVVGLALLGGLIFAVFWAEFASLGGRARLEAHERRAPETVLAGIGYIAAFLLYAAIYQSKTRSLFSAPAIIMVTLLLALRQLRMSATPDGVPQSGNRWSRTALYGAVVALAAGEITWALNYWPLNGLLGGAFLLAVFYFLVGLFSLLARGAVSARALIEYGAVCGASVAAITAAGLLRRAF